MARLNNTDDKFTSGSFLLPCLLSLGALSNEVITSFAATQCEVASLRGLEPAAVS